MGCNFCNKKEKIITQDLKLILAINNASTITGTNAVHSREENIIAEESKLEKRIKRYLFQPRPRYISGNQKVESRLIPTNMPIPDIDLPLSSTSPCLPKTEQYSTEALHKHNHQSPKVDELMVNKRAEVPRTETVNRHKKKHKKHLPQTKTITEKEEPELQSLNTFQRLNDQLIIDCSCFKGERRGCFNEYYKLLEPIGKGSFGSVYKSRHFLTSDIRAVKIVAKQWINEAIDPEIEFEILRKLDHPNIIRFYEYFQDNYNYYLITEFCDGGELFQQIARMKHFSERKASNIIQQVLSAIAYCHDNDIVHRDLKPQNLLLESKCANSPIKIIDFGGSIIFKKNEKQRNESFGSPYYVAPEMLKQKYNEKCDIWSCGVLLYILLYGKPPFDGRTTNSIVEKILIGKFRLSGQEQISKEAKSLISKMLEYKSKQRISAKIALNDPWILLHEQKHKDKTTNSLQTLETLKSLQNFTDRQKFQEAVVVFLSTQMQSKNEEKKLREMFSTFDTNKDGQLSREELISGYIMLFGNEDIATMEVDKIMKHYDVNHNGLLDYSEFIMANTNLNNILSEEKLKAAFIQFDLDGNGVITSDELKEIMGGGLEMEKSDKYFAKLIAESDKNGDGQVNQMNENIFRLISKNLRL